MPATPKGRAGNTDLHRLLKKRIWYFMTDSKHYHITEKIIGAAYNVHNTLGSGFLEKVYQNSLAIELQSFGFIIGVEKVSHQHVMDFHSA